VPESRGPARNSLNDIWSLEKFYLTDLMSHHDPVEGISAFLEHRAPVWTHQ